MKSRIMKSILSLLSICTVLLLLTLLPAKAATADTSGKVQHIYDDAKLLSSSDLNSTEAMCTQYSEKDGLDIIILTHNNSDAEYAKQYISDFYDRMLYKNCIILLVDMAHRDVFIEDFGNRARSKISSGKIDTIVSDITPYLSGGDYQTAFQTFIEKSDYYMNQTPIYFNPLLQLALALLIGAGVVAVMAYNAGGRMTVGGNNYIDSSHSGLIGRRDDYIRTHITRVPIPKNNGGGGGGGGISAGGHAFNSGGGKF